MTQPVSPEDALKACQIARIYHSDGTGEFYGPEATRTDPPSALDDEVVRALTITTEALDIALGPWDGAGKVNGIKLIADTRALLTRLKGRGNG